MSEVAYLLNLHREGRITDDALDKALKRLGGAPAEEKKMSAETKANLKRAKKAATAIMAAAAAVSAAQAEKKAPRKVPKATKATKAAKAKEKRKLDREAREWDEFLDATLEGARRA